MKCNGEKCKQQCDHCYENKCGIVERCLIGEITHPLMDDIICGPKHQNGGNDDEVHNVFIKQIDNPRSTRSVYFPDPYFFRALCCSEGRQSKEAEKRNKNADIRKVR